MKVIVTGATGTAGSEVLRQALSDRNISEVCVLTRKQLAFTDPKMKIYLMRNFLDYSEVIPLLSGYEACLWCLGISQNAVKKDEYEKITFGYALAAARAMKDLSPNFKFCFLSGQGADSKEKSRILFARIKGKTENALTALGRPKAFHFRPAYIHAINTLPKLKVERWIEPITPLFYRLLPGMILSTVELAKGMLYVAKHGCERTILDNNHIRAISRRLK